MDNNQDFETYLFISPNKLIISAIIETSKKIYEKELILKQDSNKLNFGILDNFLNNNIFKIENLLNDFVKKVFVIIDFDDFFSIELSIKKNNYENIINLQNLNHLLIEAKDCCKETIDERKIIHMMIKNYLINNKNYSYLPKDLICNSFSLDLKFICLSNNLIENLEEILKKYQISLGKIIDARYVKDLFPNDNQNLIDRAKETIEGCNKNEIMLVPKTQKNKGFFEKFFHWF